MLPQTPALVEAVGASDSFLSMQEHLSRVAQVERPILLIGERGTGKELAAARLHYLSRRWQGPMVTLNCAALPESLLETELFGHEVGAFTGASVKRMGKFEQAHGGTLFLDEIGAMPLRVQEAVLRAVEYGEFQRVGGKSITVDVRIVAATNADLPQMVSEGTFKADLLDRLSFDVVPMPPLRERGDDVLLLAHHFSAAIAVELNLNGLPEFTEKAQQILLHHIWPGNIRELKNTIERSIFREGMCVDKVSLNPFDTPWQTLLPTPSAAEPPMQVTPPPPVPLGGGGVDLNLPLKSAMSSLEQEYLLSALRQSRHHQQHAAELLGLSYHQFRGLYRKHKQAIEA